MKRKEKKTAAVMASIMLCLSCLAGCGAAGNAGQETETTTTASETTGEEAGATDETAEKEPETSIETTAEESDASAAQEQEEPSAAEEMELSATVTNDGRGELISDEDAAALSYMKKYMVEDFFNDGETYEVYAPDGSDNTDGFLGYIDHGISFFASVYSNGEDVVEEFPYMMLNETLKSKKTELESSGFFDVRLGKVVKNGEDRYVAASAMREDYFGTPYQETMLFYLDVPKTGVGVLWQMEIDENQMDDMTGPMLAEIGQCYGIGMESLIPDGDWETGDAARRVEEQDVYEPEEGEPVLTKVDGYQYLGQATLSLKDGEIQCPIMAPMGAATRLRESYVTASMHGVSVYTGSGSTGTDQYVPRMKDSASRSYEQKLNDESVENRNVHKSEVMKMSGFQDAYYYIIDYETPDTVTGEYYKVANVNCWIIIEEKYALTYDITLRDNEFDTATNTLLRELETAYGIDLSGYYNEE